jgi:hypothetical protein
VKDDSPAAGHETVVARQNAEQFGVVVTTNAAALPDRGSGVETLQKK